MMGVPHIVLLVLISYALGKGFGALLLAWRLRIGRTSLVSFAPKFCNASSLTL